MREHKQAAHENGNAHANLPFMAHAINNDSLVMLFLFILYISLFFLKENLIRYTYSTCLSADDPDREF